MAYKPYMTQETPPTHHLMLHTFEVGDFLDLVKFSLLKRRTFAILNLQLEDSKGFLVITCPDSSRCRDFLFYVVHLTFLLLAFVDLDISVRMYSM